MTPGARDAAIAAVLAPIAPESRSRHRCDIALPDALPAFLEACGKLAAEAVARGDRRRARQLAALAARAAASGLAD